MPINMNDIKALDITERIKLVEDIWDSIAKEQHNVVLSTYEKQVLDKRLKRHKQSPNEFISWNDIKAKLRQ